MLKKMTSTESTTIKLKELDLRMVVKVNWLLKRYTTKIYYGKKRLAKKNKPLDKGFLLIFKDIKEGATYFKNLYGIGGADYIPYGKFENGIRDSDIGADYYFDEKIEKILLKQKIKELEL